MYCNLLAGSFCRSVATCQYTFSTCIQMLSVHQLCLCLLRAMLSRLTQRPPDSSSSSLHFQLRFSSSFTAVIAWVVSIILHGIIRYIWEFLRATACSSKRVLAIVILSVRPSVTTRYRFKPRYKIGSGFLRYDSVESLVCSDQISCRWVRRFPSNEGIKKGYPPKKSLFYRY